MGRSFQIGVFAGIPVKVHWSFGFMLFFILFLGQANGLNAEQMVWFSIYVLVLFFCVILHEYGHALTAKRYDVDTLDIIISPIGGLARLKNLPEKPLQELFIAIAGPLVNVFIAIIIGSFIYFGYGENPFDFQGDLYQIHIFPEFLKMVLLINIALFVFNLIPAFPMDGGRVLRSLLAMKLGRLKATMIASTIGKILAVGFVIAAVMNQHLILGFVGIFIFSMAHAEYKQIKLQDKLKTTSIGDLAVKNYKPLNEKELITSIPQEGELKSHIVVNDLGLPVGTLPIHFIDDAKENLSNDLTVGQIASSKIRYVDISESVESVKQLMQKEGLSIVAVTKNGQLHGAVDRDIILDFISSY